MAPKFSLQNVLDIRHGKVEVLEIELGKLLAAHHETQKLYAALQEYQTSLLDQLSETQSGEIDLVMMNLLRLNILQIVKHVDTVSLELKKQEKEIDAKRAEVIQAKQAEETLVTLKRNRNEIYLAEQVQIEAQVQDDIYIARAFRNQQQGA
jgi:flagellar export protein FliJ